jgi:hypothetical protein
MTPAALSAPISAAKAVITPATPVRMPGSVVMNDLDSGLSLIANAPFSDMANVNWLNDKHLLPTH